MELGSEPVYLDKIDWLLDSLSMLLLTAAALGMSSACGDCLLLRRVGRGSVLKTTMNAMTCSSPPAAPTKYIYRILTMYDSVCFVG